MAICFGQNKYFEYYIFVKDIIFKMMKKVRSPNKTKKGTITI